MKTKLFYLVMVTLFTILSCHKDDETFSETDITKFSAEVVQEIQSTIIGYVYDENNKPVTDATVMIYSTQTKTNENGLFVLENAKMDKQGTYIKIFKAGFILGSDFVYPQKNATTYSYTKLLSLSSSDSFLAMDGGVINAEDGGKITFAAQCILDNNGNAYNGKVFVTAKYLSPNAKDLSDKMPGGLMADAANGNTVILGTLGMMAIELRDETGNELQLDKQKPAEIQFPINTTFSPETIQLWSFDEDKGRWKEEGIATKSNNVYIAKVNHFSFWNCDAPFPLIEVCGRVVDNQGNPLSNVRVSVDAMGLGISYGYTNSDGVFCGKMPKNVALKISFKKFSNCDQGSNMITVGPFNTNTTLADFVFTATTANVLEGTIVCNGVPIPYGIIMVNINDKKTIFTADESGKYRIDFSFLTCEDPFEAQIFGFDNNNSKTSPIYVVKSANIQTLSIDVCKVNCNFTSMIKFDCDKRIDAIITGGSGNFNYKWSTGSTESFIIAPDPLNPTTYCVTVTDNIDSCVSIACGLLQLPNGYINTDCSTNEITFQSTNNEVLTYSWSNGSTTKSITTIIPGIYTVTVTSTNSGCSKVYTTDFTQPPLLDNNVSFCNKNLFNFYSSYFTFGYATNNAGKMIPLDFPIEINLLDIGFDFNIFISDNNECNNSTVVSIPRLVNGLNAIAQNTTCPTCNDGKINITTNPNALCTNCTFGSVKVFNIGDLNTDLTAQNDAGTLAKGTYYVVVTDQNNGCFIAFQEVVIN